MVFKKNPIIFIAHGSRIASANDEVQQLAQQLQAARQGPVIACFLELAEPSIPEAIQQALRESAEEILIFPYFLTGGRHVRKDIPKIVEEAMADQKTPYRILPYWGAHPALISFLESAIREFNEPK